MMNSSTNEAVHTVRECADQLDHLGRAELLQEIVRAVYDSEKFAGVGGEGLDGRDSEARRQFAAVSDAAMRALTALHQ